jgi:hypothetical protein
MSIILNLSDKFANDLNKFFIWADENNYVVKKDDEVVNWSQNMLPDFIEPSRNKINAYVKELFQFYKLYDKNNLPIEETFIKIIIKEFKENKPTLKKSKKNEIDEITDDIQNANREPSSTNKRKYTKRSIKNMTEQNKKNITKISAKKYDLISAMFSIHYLFKDDETVNAMVNNFSLLKSGGYFLCCLFDGNLLHENISLQNGNRVNGKREN